MPGGNACWYKKKQKHLNQSWSGNSACTCTANKMLQDMKCKCIHYDVTSAGARRQRMPWYQHSECAKNQNLAKRQLIGVALVGAIPTII